MKDYERIKKILNDYEEVRKKSHYSYHSDFETALEKLNVLGLEWGDPLPSGDFAVVTGNYHLTNSALKYRADPSKYYIYWDNGIVGRLQFISSSSGAYDAIQPEWDDFLSEMRDGCVDYDPLNCHIIYDIKRGLEVMRHYKKLCEQTK